MTTALPFTVLLMVAFSPRDYTTGVSQSNLVLGGLTSVTIRKVGPSANTDSVLNMPELYALVEGRLRERGVPVKVAAGLVGRLWLEAGVSGDEKFTSVSVTLSLSEEVELRRAPGTVLRVPTWSSSISDRGSSPAKPRLHKATLQAADRFVAAWEKAHAAAEPAR